MNFYHLSWGDYRRSGIRALKGKAIFPCMLLISNSWDDYGYRTTFDVAYFTDVDTEVFDFSAGIKILQRTNEETYLRKHFVQLSNDYCSLGQSLEYYRTLSKLGVVTYRSILQSLRDVVFNKSIAEEFSELYGFSNSLLRFSEAEKAYKEADALFAQGSPKKPRRNRLKFRYRCRVGGAQNDHVIDFNFTDTNEGIGLSRITALIGKNGTGKTQVLANFARTMSGISITGGKFSPERPPFSKVISISYSVFDEFARPIDDLIQDVEEREILLEKLAYQHAQLKRRMQGLDDVLAAATILKQSIEQDMSGMNEILENTNHSINLEIIERRISASFDLIASVNDFILSQNVEREQVKAEIKTISQKQLAQKQQLTRLSETKHFFSYVYCGLRRGESILSQSEIREKLFMALEIVNETNRSQQWQNVIRTLLEETLDPLQLENLTTENFSEKLYDGLSSGQRILLLVLTEVMANIEPESVILFDEPELHLHPNAISALARAFHILLAQFNSYAIIATHSPIIIQEIPSGRVRVFHRDGNYVSVSVLGNESFGENITNIIDNVFESAGSNNNFREHFATLLEKYSVQEIVELFHNNLSFNARAALTALDKSRSFNEDK